MWCWHQDFRGVGIDFHQLFVCGNAWNWFSRGPLDLTKLQNKKSHSFSSSSSRSFFSIYLGPKVTGHIYCWKAPCFLDKYTNESYTTAKDILKMFAVRILQFKKTLSQYVFLRTYRVQETTVFTLKYRVSCKFFASSKPQIWGKKWWHQMITSVPLWKNGIWGVAIHPIGPCHWMPHHDALNHAPSMPRRDCLCPFRCGWCGASEDFPGTAPKFPSHPVRMPWETALGRVKMAWQKNAFNEDKVEM